MTESRYVLEATRENFNSAVVENSFSVPVIVDFWAEWCGPCKILMPLLDKLVAEYEGKFLLAKVNTEEQRELAMQHQIRSIPTLKVFKNGAVVDEIMGAQPEGVLRELIERHLTRESDILRQQARVAYQQGDSQSALRLLDEAARAEPENYEITLDRVQVYLQENRIDEARQLVQTLPLAVSEQADAAALIARLEFAEAARDAPDPASLEKTIQNDPGNLAARYQAGARKVLTGDYAGALEYFLNIMQRDRSFRDDVGRKAMISVFNLLNNEGELVARYRKRMFNILH